MARQRDLVEDKRSGDRGNETEPLRSVKVVRFLASDFFG